ncbi:hypothetical protein QCD70_12810 [Agreia sp. PsM10]|uniref:hypothetical protein n=1 Tax=Agreia sp. PsM10 TaxID=3030533 RepID=UPI00263A4D35|nr:hypothetical protein [Agreia sp. PsM10]MDN4641132.1 hypothetical protein [Agreia sp. PsM10]
MDPLTIILMVFFVVLVVLAVGAGLGIYFLVRASNRRSQGQAAEQPPAPSGEGPGAAPRI